MAKIEDIKTVSGSEYRQLGWNFTSALEKQPLPPPSRTLEEVMERVIGRGQKVTSEMGNQAMSEPDEDKYKHCAYMSAALRRKEIDESVEKCVTVLEKKRFDTIAFRGLSGMLIGPIVAHWLGKEVIVIRKNSDNHSNHTVEGHLAAKKYVVLDDFIQTGETVREIINRVKEFSSVAEVAGGVFYSQYDTPWYTAKTLKERICEI